MSIDSGTNPLNTLDDAPLIQERFNGQTRVSRDEIARAISWVKYTFESMKQARANTERQWYLNLSFYFGKQHVVFRQSPNLAVGGGGHLYVPPAPYWRSRPVINRIRPIIRTELSKLTSQKPSAYVVPASSDDHDLFAAQAGEQIWDSTYRRHRLRSVFRKAVWWQLVCGNAYLKNYWDPNKVDEDSDQLGDLVYMAETPFHVFVPDLREEDIENQPYIMHAQLRTEDWCKVNYPNVNFRSSGDAEEEILNSSWLNIIGANNGQGQKTVLCLEVWIKPRTVPMFPDGAMLTIVGDQIVQGLDGWPFEKKSYPFAKLSHIPTGKYYTDSTIVDLIPLQKEYNRTRGQVIEAKNKMAKPQLVAEKGSIVPGKITTEPGLVIEYEPGFEPPKPLPLMALPQYVIDEQDRILADMNDISGQHEITKGQVPPGVTAATAINYLQEQDESKLSVSFESLEEAIEKVAGLTLSYVKQFWDTPRIVKVIGTDGSFDAASFKGADLRGNTDIRIEGGSSLPTSKAAKQALIMDLMKMQFIPPETGLEVMEIGGIQKIYENMRVDVRQAQRENLRLASINEQIYAEYNAQQQQIIQMEQLTNPAAQEIDPETGMPFEMAVPPIIPTNTWDRDELHIEIHNKYRKSQAFELLPPEAKQAFEEHVAEHEFKVREKLMQEMQMGVPPEDAATGEAPGPESMPEIQM